MSAASPASARGLDARLRWSQIRILDVADSIGAFAGRLLADLGADVVKVEPVYGDGLRARPPFAHDDPAPEKSLAFAVYNAGKRGVTLDLTTDDGKRLFHSLLATADVVLETAAPGWFDEQGIGYQSMAAEFPALIWAAVTPYGQNGPYAHFKGSDLSAQAMGGALVLAGEPGGQPVRGPEHMAEKMGGYVTAFAVATALFERKRSRRGQYIDISLEEVVVSQLEGTATLWTYEHRLMPREGRRYNRVTCPAAIFRCKDGWVTLVASTVQQWSALAEWINDETLNDPRYMDQAVRFSERNIIDPIIERWMASVTKLELFAGGQQRRIPMGICSTPEEVVRDPHLRARSYFVAQEHPAIGAFDQPHLGAVLGSSDVNRRPAPLLGQHNEELFGEIGVSPEGLARLRRRGIV